MQHAVVVFAALLCLFSSIATKASASTCSSVESSSKVDCGYTGVTQSECESQSCCWQQLEDNSKDPWCFKPAPVATDYHLKELKETKTGMSAVLDLVDPSKASGNFEQLSVQFVYESVSTFRFKIVNADQESGNKNDGGNWEIPQSIISRKSISDVESLNKDDLLYKVDVQEKPFRLTVTRKSDGEQLFHMDKALLYQEQYIEVSTSYSPSSKTFGLGESTRVEQALIPGSTYTLWAADIPAASMYKNLYGSFPYYLQLTESGATHGAMLLNSNGMDVVLGADSLTFKTIGGVVDMYIFAGDSPADVIKQYTNIVGRPMMQAYWSLGFHNCKYGYTSVKQVESVVEGYQQAGIPLDTQWMDIDYMQDYRDWTWSSTGNSFDEKAVSHFVDNLHKDGLHFVPIVDPGIMVYNNYPAYEDGIKKGLFVKDITNNADSFYLGQVWPGPVNFPDFTHPQAQAYWSNSVKDFWSGVNIDGLWIDMNEVSNFCNSDGTGQVCTNPNPANCPTGNIDTQTTCCLECTTVDSTNKYDFPPYRIHNQQGNGNLGAKTMSPSAWRHDNVSEYNTHNLYGLTEQIATNVALTDARGERPFLLTRSSFISSGKHTAKWTGDNAATWADLRASIVGVVDFNLFGIPMIGADICGFLDDTTEELCARWIEVGAFYPFSRNHNTLGAAPQELYLWESVTAASKNALGIRYQILPYLYTLFYHAFTTGDTVARSLWLNFPQDSQTHDISDQFMLGKNVLISPVLDESATSVSAYFPKGNYWYDFTTHARTDASSHGVRIDIDTPLTSVNVHIRGGTVMPMHAPGSMTTTEALTKPYRLLIALCPNGKAFGDLFLDDGLQVEGDISQSNLQVQYEATADSKSVIATVINNSFKGAEGRFIESVTILGANEGEGEGDDDVVLEGLQLDITKPFTLEW